MTSVILPCSDLAEIDRILAEKIHTIPADFFTAQPLVADISALEGFSVDISWLRSLKSLFAVHKLMLVGISGSVANDVLASAGLTAIVSNTPKSPKVIEKIVKEVVEKVVEKPVEVPTGWKNCKVIRQPIRSGQQIYASGCDLVIIGAVSAGAEVYGDGNIYIYGSLRGRVFAGAKGNKNVLIYCHELSAELISIAGFYQDMEQLQVYRGQENCLITLNDDETMKIESL